MPSTVDGIAFGVLALALVGGALGMLVTRNIMHAGFWLLEISVAAAGLYYLLGADYIALVQLLVYAGAVSVLIIFSIMITLRRREDAERPRDFSWSAALLAVAFCVMIGAAILGFQAPVIQQAETAPDLVAFGRILFSPSGWALPFEIASAVLTAALVGAVWWSGKGDK
ncbi:MAG: NADH-quinone oxidoreductase subunit J [Coriobacteriia bacterium]|nr:NADH-quinone oxidoreductase subunit J [Coriobacteriia bacterium]